ncbi:MAG: hypothetical protein WCS94_21505 [Verrucomicrobiota bacterium]
MANQSKDFLSCELLQISFAAKLADCMVLAVQMMGPLVGNRTNKLVLNVRPHPCLLPRAKGNGFPLLSGWMALGAQAAEGRNKKR